jgi:hypothetical protein
MLLNAVSADDDVESTAACDACYAKGWKQCLKGNDLNVGKCCDPSAASGSADYCDPTW